jgi:CheY-like chemotaxis protein
MDPLANNGTHKDSLHTILLVDDDKFILDMYANKFETKGYNVHAVSNAEEALTIIQSGADVHVALLDIMMPGMSGLELLKKVKDEDLLPGAAIIMLTNQGSDSEIKEAKDLGVDGYIVKAMTIPSEVLEKVETIHAEKHS